MRQRRDRRALLTAEAKRQLRGRYFAQIEKCATITAHSCFTVDVSRAIIIVRLAF